MTELVPVYEVISIIPGEKMMKAIKLILAGILLFSFLTPARAQEEGEEKNIVTVLKGMFPQASIEIDPFTNTLLVTAPPSLQEKIKRMIERLDVYHPQITIEAKFVELTVTDINELGVDLEIPQIKTGSTLAQGKMKVTNDWTDSDTGWPQETARNLFYLTRIDNTAFSLMLQALEKLKKADVLSAPKVTTLNGQPATIAITRTIPYISEVNIEEGESSTSVQQITWTISYKDAGIYLEVTPRVAEGSTLITLDIKPTVRELISQLDILSGLGVPSDLGWPVIDERITNTTMIIDSGETVVMGGLMKIDSKTVEKKVPILGSIPLLGYAFRYKYSQEEKKNLLIFVTAYLLSPSGEKTVARR